MAQADYVVDITFKAAATLAAYQYHAVVLSAANTVTVAGANAIVIGILQNKPDAAGEAATVRMVGESKMVAGERMDLGTMITSKSDGHGERADANAEHCYAIALESCSSDGEIVSVLLNHCDAYATDDTAPTP
jgi:hypothetical protein